jgi:DNA-binding HxlR family transcriptional regulator
MENREEMMLNALNHGVRRDILRVINGKGSATYTQILDRTELTTGKLNYHLKQLTGVIEKTASDEYQLTPLGITAVSILDSIHSNGMDNYFKRLKEVQTKSVSPFMKSFFKGAIVVVILMLGFWGFMGYLMYTEGGPRAIWIILGILYVLGTALLIFLIRVLKFAPEYAERIERKLFGDR